MGDIGIEFPALPVMSVCEAERGQGKGENDNGPPVVILEECQTDSEVVEQEKNAYSDNHYPGQPAALGFPLTPGGVVFVGVHPFRPV